ncbi:uncharacterized protein LOC123511536 isoform X3 [Portunus trituberculatus]|uniref:uncharacterized protein LOC123511536 isoform X3 n=1 Tax=Portunus trituberculatus TaxID=210409 RepID=UPI001E1CF305|nr:uncharacterized protein LOC123511536 isoform X3 [Portunus trituberculatus]
MTPAGGVVSRRRVIILCAMECSRCLVQPIGHCKKQKDRDGGDGNGDGDGDDSGGGDGGGGLMTPLWYTHKRQGHQVPKGRRILVVRLGQEHVFGGDVDEEVERHKNRTEMVKTRTFSNLSKQNLYLRSDSGKTTRPEQTRLRHSVTRHGNPHRAM